MEINTQKGYTALFAVLVSSLVLAVGMGILNITLKEITLSASGRESQFAFYAADTGAECALFWDLSGIDVFATSSYVNNPQPGIGGPTISCLNTPFVAQPVLSDDYSATSTFSISFTEGYCAEVRIGKHDKDSDGTSDTTVIDARGYNTCDPTNPRRIERGLRISY